jgi:xyloglucan-specific exo-beta-1,4-glucanase
LISPPRGAHLLSGVGDIDGFRHDDVDDSPAGGTFAGPRYSNTEDLAFAGKNSLVIVRTGTVGNQDVRAAYSRDGGTTWQEMQTEPPTGNGAGAIAISADAKTIVWTPRGGEPYFTRDWGTNWTACAGLAAGIRVTADAVDPQHFYAFDASSGKFHTSTNGAASFTATTTVLAAEENNGFGFGGGVTVTATPGIENDLWLASRTGGLFHSTNGGASFAKLERVQAANSLGLGKAAPGKNFPALFLAGTIGGVPALFRSDDTGENWVRINDARHQYGYISHLTGDPRIYGRVYFATGGRGVIYGEINGGPVLGEK